MVSAYFTSKQILPLQSSVDVSFSLQIVTFMVMSIISAVFAVPVLIASAVGASCEADTYGCGYDYYWNYGNYGEVNLSSPFCFFCFCFCSCFFSFFLFLFFFFSFCILLLLLLCLLLLGCVSFSSFQGFFFFHRH